MYLCHIFSRQMWRAIHSGFYHNHSEFLLKFSKIQMFLAAIPILLYLEMIEISI